MEFLNATYLWGFLGILLPVAIHLWSRKKVVTIKVGSIKLLQASEPKQNSNIKLNEWWLLILRILMVAMLVLILSEPVLNKRIEKQSVNYLVEPSLLNDDRLSSFLDTISEEKVRLLTKDFPYAKDFKSYEYPKVPKYWQLAQEIQKINADSIVVFSKGYLKGVKGRRPSIRANTKWIVLASEDVLETPIAAKQKQNDFEITAVVSSANFLMFEKDSISEKNDLLEFNVSQDSVRLISSKTNWLPLTSNETLSVGILSNDSLPEQMYYFKAAYRAISKFLDQPIEIVVDPEGISLNDLNTLVILNDSLPLDVKRNILVYKPDALANQLIESGTTSNSFYLTELLNSENIVTNRFADQLLLLLNTDKSIDEYIQNYDQRTLAESDLQPLHIADSTVKNSIQFFEMSSWLWLFLIPIVIVERILSRIRKQ